MKKIASLVTFMIFLLLATGSSDSRTPEERAADRCEDEIMAFVMSESFVEGRLRAPSTADFPSFSSEGVRVTYLGDCKHRVSAYVDAQNAFGGIVRTRYVAEVQNELGTDTWRLLSLDM